jgi:hypothetical protein
MWLQKTLTATPTLIYYPAFAILCLFPINTCAASAQTISPVVLDGQSNKSIHTLLAQNADENTSVSGKAIAGSPALKSTPSAAGYSTAQSINKASIHGKVFDFLTNDPLPNVRLVLSKAQQEHQRFLTESKSDGSYSFNNVEPGDYTLTLAATDKLSETKPVKLAAGENEELNFKMEDLEGTDLLRITGKRTLIHPENIGSETYLDKTIVSQYKTGNDLKELIDSTPGVIYDTYGNIITRGEHNSVNYMLDGVVLPEAAGVLQQSQFVTPRSLQSMKVDIGGYQAEDGGGPLGAVIHMKSLPITPQPYFTFGQQTGYPMAGNLWYSGSTAFSQDPNNPLYKLRIESSGAFNGTSMGEAPPVKDYTHNNRWNINSLTKLEYLLTERDTVNLTLGINHSFLQVPTSRLSAEAGVSAHQHDAQDYLILNYKHKFKRFFDEGNLHIVNSFYYENYHSRNVFDPDPVINGGQPLQSIAPNALRFDYAFSAQGDINKVVLHTHHLKAGFLDEIRPTYTNFYGSYYNNDPTAGIPVGALISPFTGNPVGPGNPQFTKAMGGMHSFRFLQSAYFQDSWRPDKGFLKRLTVDSGVRFDYYHGVFGNTLPVLAALETIPGAIPINPQPYMTQRVNDAQASGRFGGSFVLTKNTVIRGSFSNLFMPPPVDIFSTPPSIVGGPIVGNYNGFVDAIYNGTVRPMRATRGKLTDVSLERQLGPRFVARTNLFYKTLENYGDSGVIGNSTLYNRQSVDKQEAYGVETRMDLKKSKDGYGFYGFLSNTVVVAYLRGSKQVVGGIYDIQTTPVESVYPDHDRRIQLVSALGYQSRKNWWIFGDFQFLSGLQNELPIGVVVGDTYYGYHASRTPVLGMFDLNFGFKIPQKIRRRIKFAPNSIDMRIQNLTNLREATNLGSPFQGTRYLLPFRFLIGCEWGLGKDPLAKTQVATRPNSNQMANTNAPSPTTPTI